MSDHNEDKTVNLEIYNPGRYKKWESIEYICKKLLEVLL